jgi:hypothetical protein
MLCLAWSAAAYAAPAERADNLVGQDARVDAARTAADRCRGDIAPIEGRTGSSPDDYRCIIPDFALVDILDRLSSAPPESLSVSDVSRAFNLKFEQFNNAFGDKYVAGFAEQNPVIELFVLPDHEYRFNITRIKDQRIKDWRSRLLEKGWSDSGIIRHPFVQDAFYKDGKQIRLEHNMENIISIVVLGFNVSKTVQ